MNTVATTATATAAVPAAPRARRTGWHRLEVTEVRPLTPDAVAVTLHVPGDLRDTFTHRPGQHVVVRHRRAGGELRRSYSVCPPPGDPAALRLVIGRGTPHGFGAHAVTSLAPGDHLELSPPTGAFALPDLPGAHHVMVAGGTGVTPLAAMAAAVLREDPACRVSLVHAVPTTATALLADELAELKDTQLDRFTVLHVLTREDRPSELVSGRIDPAKLLRLLTALDARPGPGTTFALCGPAGLVTAAHGTLTGWGADPAAVRTELFTTDGTPRDPSRGAPPAAAPARTAGETRITALFAGRRGAVTQEPEDRVILDALLRDHPDVPYACRDGVCGSCRAKVLSGEVELEGQYALDAEDLAAGYTLVCRARPRSAEVTLDFDA
ncbi:2Fe-2S iron-sulfur cluster-binding protein [Streptomyces sp. CRN 30]|uniref:2Fe-2S iron-sulfur cluster-binding protein n=1 Tax=Streptomyces sp. CRN 30 TaxID=3075613 RepID=UPI002A82DEE8|nr:2Fe-2S iron-sulfur cluster-binding protein [Streptomyces sp. CRN 30]